MSRRTTIYLGGPLKILDENRGKKSLSGRIAEVIDRYLEILKAERGVFRKFTDDELTVIKEMIGSSGFQPAGMIKLLGEDLEEFLVDDFGKELGDRRLIQKVKDLSFAQKCALVEFFEGPSRNLKEPLRNKGEYE